MLKGLGNSKYNRITGHWTQDIHGRLSVLLEINTKGAERGFCSLCHCHQMNWVGLVHWRRKWQPTPLFLPGESHGQGSLAVYSPWGGEESDMTEATEHASTHSQLINSDSAR